MKKNLFIAIGAFLGGILIAFGGMVMANAGDITVNGTLMTPENTVTTTDENGTNHVELKEAEPEDPLPVVQALVAKEAPLTQSTSTNCTQ